MSDSCRLELDAVACELSAAGLASSTERGSRDDPPLLLLLLMLSQCNTGDWGEGGMVNNLNAPFSLSLVHWS